MRIIAGEFRSRLLKSLPGDEIRPTPDRLREALFNVLAPRMEDTVFVDAYAGTGAVGIEALSRGARRAIFLENNKAAVKLIHENLRALGIAGQAEVMRGKAHQLIAGVKADIVFLDPPYPKDKEYEQFMMALAEALPPLVIAQHASRFVMDAMYGDLVRFRVLKQGDNTLSFFEPSPV